MKSTEFIKVDNLPVAVRNEELGFVTREFPVGFIATVPSKKEQHFFNHDHHQVFEIPKNLTDKEL